MGAAADDFGRTADGAAVQAVTLAAGALSVRVITLGAILQDVRLAGVAHGLTLGSERVADYEGAMRHHGSVIGPVANRISGARATIDGRDYVFEANQDGTIKLHSGAAGTHLRLWTLDEAGPDHAQLSIAMADGEGGFPGNRRLVARYELAAPAVLRLTLTAATDAPTLMNPVNHSYWNLDGTPRWDGHHLRVAAERFLPSTPAALPRGPVVPVGGTPYDLRRGHALRPGAPPFDTCYCLSDDDAPLREVLWLTGRSGVRMAIATTAPGMQVYDGRAARRPGHGFCEGLAFEPQRWPDAPTHPAYPSILMRPGAAWRQVSEWRFAA